MLGCSALPGRLPPGSRTGIWPALGFALLLPLRCATGLFLLQDYRRYILLLLLMFVTCHPYASIALKSKKITQRLNCMKGASVIARTRNNAFCLEPWPYAAATVSALGADMSAGPIILPSCVWTEKSVSLLQEVHFHWTFSSHAGHCAICCNSPPHDLQDAIFLYNTSS
jgi:hypothetical protein